MNNDPREHLSPEQKRALDLGHQIGQHFITDDAFAKRFRKLCDTSKETFERDGQHSHLMSAYLRDESTKKLVVVLIQFADWPPPEGKKEQTLMGLGVKLAEDHRNHTLVMISHVSEAWMATQQAFASSGKANINDMTDNRIEVLTVSLTTQDFRQSTRTFRIYRSPNGKFKMWGRKPQMEMLYDPTSDVHPGSEGDFLPHAVIKGYILARAKQREEGLEL